MISAQTLAGVRPLPGRPTSFTKPLTQRRTNTVAFWGRQQEPELDKNVRVDENTLLAQQARVGYARAIQGGESKMRLAEAALWVSAEDEALASKSPAPFHVPGYLARMSAAAIHVKDQLAAQNLLPEQQTQQPLQQQVPYKKNTGSAQPFGPVDVEDVLTVVEKALFAEPRPRKARVGPSQKPTKVPVASLGFKVPPHGRTALPNKAAVNHAGTWETAQDAYLHEALAKRVATPAVLAIIYSQVMSELFADGAVDFAVSMDMGDYHDPPSAVPVPGINRSMIPKGQVQQPQQQQQPLQAGQKPLQAAQPVVPVQPEQPPQELNRFQKIFAKEDTKAASRAKLADQVAVLKAEAQKPEPTKLQKMFGKPAPAVANVAQVPPQVAKEEAKEAERPRGIISSLVQKMADPYAGSDKSAQQVQQPAVEVPKPAQERSFMDKILHSRLPGTAAADVVFGKRPVGEVPIPVNLGQGFNTCSMDVLAEQQRHLKRSFWCWEWDGREDTYDNGGHNSLGGFRAAARSALGEDVNGNTLTAMAPKGTPATQGDLKRARAACERLVMLKGANDQHPEERRDLSVVLLHAGDLAGAKTELNAYMISNAFVNRADPVDKALCQRLMAKLNSAGVHKTAPLTVDRVLGIQQRFV